jgi:hypothetical protein
MPPVAHLTPPFTPAPAATDALIAAITDPTLSLQTVTAQHNTTVEALSLWLIRPDIRERLERLDSISAWRTRLTASAALDRVVGTLSTFLQNFIDRRPRLSATPQTPASRTKPDADSADPISESERAKQELLELRTEEHIRRSAALLLRLANLRPVAGHDKLAPAIPRTPADRPRHTPDSHAAALENLHSTLRNRPQATSPTEDQPGNEHPNKPTPASAPAVPISTTPTIISPFADPLPDLPPRKPILTTLRKPTTSPTQLRAAATREHWP